MAEAVDGLQLVADREQVASVEAPQYRELARIGVLELVDHQQLEALGPGGPQALAVGEQLPRQQLEVVEVHDAPKSLEPLIGPCEALEQLSEQLAGA